MRRLLTTIAILLWACAATGREPPSPRAVSGIGRPQYFAVSVEDVDRSAAWYSDLFGLSRLDDERAPDGSWRIVNLASEDLFVEVIWDRRDTSVPGARGFAKVGFGVEDVEEVADRIEKATGDRPRVVDMAKHRIRILQLRDPDGNIIQLSSPMARGR